MLHLFTCTAKNRIHFVADFITVYTKSAGLHVPGNNPLTFTEFYIVSTALTNVPFGIWKKNNFPMSRPGYFPSHDDMQISLTVFLIDRTNLLPVTPPPTKKNNSKK